MAIKASCTITISKYRDTDSVTRYYILQSSTASAPAKPTTLTPSGWTTTEPDYTSGDTNTLYFTDRSVFSDGTFSYSDVSKSSSYEAAKEAYNKAVAAQDGVDNLDSTKASSEELSNATTNMLTNYTTAIGMIDSLKGIIQNLVVDADGNSLMTQTSDGWQFDMSSFQNSLDAAKDDIAELQTTGDLTALQKQIDTLNERTAYIRMTTTDDGDPCLELGKDGSNFKVRITNSIIQFLDGSNSAAAYISGTIFYGNNIVAKNYLQIGESPGYVWQKRANGNLGLTYKSS